MRILSLAAQTVLDAGPVGLIHAAAAAGFSYAGPRLLPVRPGDPVVCGTALEAQLIAAIETTGVAVLETGVFPISADMDWPAFTAGVALSGRIGARFIACPCDDPDRLRARDALRRLADIAAGPGIVALIEFSPRRACASLAMAGDLVASAGRANVGLLIDALHLSRSGGSPADLASVDPAWLRLVHLCDAPAFHGAGGSVESLRAEANEARLYPGEGELWLEDLLARIPADTPLSIEAPSAAHQSLPPADRARLARQATQALIARATAKPAS